MRSKELPKELRDKIVTKHRSGQGYKQVSAAFKVPKSSVACVEKTRYCSSPAQYHAKGEAWWWQHQDMGLFISWWDRMNGCNIRKGECGQTFSRVLRTLIRTKGSPSNKTMT